MESRWKTANQGPCRMPESITVGAALDVGLRFERYLGRAFWILLIGVLVWLVSWLTFVLLGLLAVRAGRGSLREISSPAGKDPASDRR